MSTGDPDGARYLLQVAHPDLILLEALAAQPSLPARGAGYFAQQTLEKTLKAWLCARTGSFPFTHNLAKLLALLAHHGEDCAAWASVARYTRYAVRDRYLMEEEVLDDGPLDLPAAVDDARGLYEFVTALVAALPD